MDLVAVLVFVVIGRSVHAHGLALPGIVSTAWPFVSGLVVGWCALVVFGRDEMSSRGGAMVTVSTVALGMALRVISGQGIAPAFVLVALAFFSATMLGWRLLRRLVRSGP
jgi:hypothetical protein